MVSAVIVNYNPGENLIKCVKSVSESVREIIIVDNASSDGSLERILNLYPSIKLIKNEENEGFSRGANIGILNSKYEYLLIMNPDVFIEKNSIHLLTKCLEEEEGVGIVSPKLISADGKIELSYGNDPSIINELLQKIKSKTGILRIKSKYVQWVSGACFMCRKKAVIEAGLFDENFFLYFEDADLCKRLRKKGWVIKYLSSASAVHIRGGSGDFEEVQCEYRKSQLLYYKKHRSAVSLLLLRGYLFLKFGFLFLIKGKPIFKKILDIVLKG